MTNRVVRRNRGELPPIPTEGEFHWLHWDPFRHMAPFSTGEEQPARFTPDFEIKEFKKSFIFNADVPGVKEKDMEITMTGNRLTISGKLEADKEENADIYYTRECSYDGFTRAFTLPEGTDDSSHIRAETQPRRADAAPAEEARAAPQAHRGEGRRQAEALIHVGAPCGVEAERRSPVTALERTKTRNRELAHEDASAPRLRIFALSDLPRKTGPSAACSFLTPSRSRARWGELS